MMKPFSAVDGPRAEVSAALPVVPPPGTPHSVTPVEAAASLSALRDAAATHPAARAAVVLVDDDASRTTDLAARAADTGLFALARELDTAGDTSGAVVALAILAGLPAGAAAGQLGLAVLATRAERFDLAADLIAPTLDSPERHPRICSLAGIIELSRGNRAGAQAWLANASRVARRTPEFRGELQLAQRALLLMHLG